MRTIVAQSLVWGACLVASLIAPAGRAVAANCALYARAETGVALYGSAGGWWDQAVGRYARGHVPAVGAILVFRRTRHIPSGHVAVVAKVVSAGEILVDQANWGRGRVGHGMSVIDTSRDHDWTSVAVIDLPSGTYGRDYLAHGFIYPGRDPGEIVEARGQQRLALYVANSEMSSDLSPTPGLLHLAAAEEQGGFPEARTTPAKQPRRPAAAHPIHQPSNFHAHHHHAAGHAKSAPRADASRLARSPAPASASHVALSLTSRPTS